MEVPEGEDPANVRLCAQHPEAAFLKSANPTIEVRETLGRKRGCGPHRGNFCKPKNWCWKTCGDVRGDKNYPWCWLAGNCKGAMD